MNTSTGRDKWEFVDVPARGTRFIALYGDGSGGNVFYRHPLTGSIFDADGDALLGMPVEDETLKNWLMDSGYGFWTALPDGMKLFFEEARK